MCPWRGGQEEALEQDEHGFYLVLMVCNCLSCCGSQSSHWESLSEEMLGTRFAAGEQCVAQAKPHTCARRIHGNGVRALKKTLHYIVIQHISIRQMGFYPLHSELLFFL